MRFLFAAFFLFSALQAAELLDPLSDRVAVPISPRNIQVLIEKDLAEALLEVKGAYYLFNPHDGTRITSGMLGKRFMVRETENGLKWGEEFPGIHQIYIKPRSSDASIFINGIQYDGSVAIFGVHGMIHIVNDIDIESYVKSILSSQFPTPLEPEVMSALAILARTNAYHFALKNPDSFWHVAAAEVKYSGSALILPNSSIERAVDSTRHLILVYPNEGKDLPFPATWTEHSAGKTARYDAIFRTETDAPDKSVIAPHAALARQESKWSYSISKNHLARLCGVPKIGAIELFVDAPSGKTYGIRVKDSPEIYDIDFATLQEKLGKTHLQSSDFQVSTKDDTVFFTGFGKGHGVGLCLYSASALAQKGENAVKILSKFFPETYLYNLDAIPDGKVRR
ncbi:MAG: SpoIID/LytB domain-containing protein [Chlamydiae bacterium]|nr:SpoIID/LytB domain-containing protein [Chlamydiota bacterium]